jgi:Leucine-rich repeat (LRR) protein
MPPRFPPPPLIQGLTASNNFLTGSLPEPSPLLYLLEILYLDGNYISATLPSIVGPILKALYCQQNFVTGSVPSALARNINLEALVLSDNF